VARGTARDLTDEGRGRSRWLNDSVLIRREFILEAAILSKLPDRWIACQHGLARDSWSYFVIVLARNTKNEHEHR